MRVGGEFGENHFDIWSNNVVGGDRNDIGPYVHDVSYDRYDCRNSRNDGSGFADRSADDDAPDRSRNDGARSDDGWPSCWRNGPLQ